MRQNFLRKCFIVLLCQSLTYTPLLRAEQLSLPSGDLVAPKIVQEKYVDLVESGTDHNITVTVTDNVGVNQVTLYYRAIGTEEYKRLAMNNIANSDDYQATLTSENIKAPGIEYYVQAMDNAGNSVLHGYSFSPLSVKTDSNADALVASSSEATVEDDDSNMWLWIGLGAAAVAVLALAGGGGGDDSGGAGNGGGNDTATLTINASNPNQ